MGGQLQVDLVHLHQDSIGQDLGSTCQKNLSKLELFCLEGRALDIFGLRKKKIESQDFIPALI